MNMSSAMLFLVGVLVFTFYQSPVSADGHLRFARCGSEMNALQYCKTPNLPWLQNRRFDLFLCEYDGTGNLTILLTGNSYSMYMYQSLLNSGRRTFKKLIVATQSGCTIHKKYPYAGASCVDVANNLPRTLADVKPDVVIINQRYWGTTVFQTPMKDPKTDAAVAAMREDWAMISNYTKKIIIIEPACGLPDNEDLLVATRLNDGDIVDYAMPLNDYEADVDPGWDRVIESVDKCSKCKLISIRQHYCDSELCDIYDTERHESFYCDKVHHASAAVERYMPAVVREIEL